MLWILPGYYLSGFSMLCSEERKVSIDFHYGPAVYAEGSILGGAGAGLQLLEDLINTGYIYSPGYSEAIASTGPFYRIPDFDVFSNQVGIDLYGPVSESWDAGIALKYSDITANIRVPVSYVNLNQYVSNLSGYYMVTNQTGGESYLVGVYELDAIFRYNLTKKNLINPYVQIVLGGGKGWLSRYNAAAEVSTLQAGGGVGASFRLTDRQAVFLYLNHTAYAVKTGKRDRINYTKVLVNPGDGEIGITRLNFGVTYDL